MSDPATSSAQRPDGRRARGRQSREAILRQAVDLASREGLEGLSIGRLAAATGMSKSGLFAHFGSKAELQLATIDAARRIYVELIVTPAAAAPPGLARLRATCDAWVGYLEARTFPGGCFWAQVAAEFDARPGAVRDAVAGVMRQWLEALAHTAREARERGELSRREDPDQLAFELNGLMLGGNWAHQLLGDDSAFEQTRAALRARLDAAAS
jgi:AcrR family transcriptional regulator